MTQSLLDEHYFNEVFGAHQTLEQDDVIEQEVGIFEKLCKNKLEELELSPTDIVSVNKFINIIDRINNRYPFVYLPYFLNDFLNGEYSADLIRKYNLWGFGSIQYLTENILKFVGKKAKKNYEEDPLEINLKNVGWEKNYIFLTKNTEIFSSELTELLNHNILTSIILVYILNNSNAKISEIKYNIEKICLINDNKIQLLNDENIRKSFYNYVAKNSEEKINSIIEKLYLKKYIKYESRDIIALYEKYFNISKLILDLLAESPNGIPYENFRRKLLKQNNLLKIIPKMGVWERELDELKNQKKIVQIKAFWRYSPYRDQLFTYPNFELRAEELREQVVSAGKTAFFGRKITPQRFMRELEQLDKGNLDDKDDQVTRLAGMVLASSSLPQAPKEDLDIFDFVTDISNYKFTSQQINAMSKINFRITGKIIHVKVMLNEKVDSKIINNIRKKLPVGHQAVIFTFKKVSKEVIRDLPNDNSIQILGKEAILAWSEITPEIPCRVDSISKVMYGTLRGKIVKVNAVDYETGFASVLAISENEEHTVPVSSLKEIWISNCDVRDYSDFTKNYEEFLRIIRYFSEPKIFDRGLFDTIIRKFEYVISHYSLIQPDEYVELNPNEEIVISIPRINAKNVNNYPNVELYFKFDDANTRIMYDFSSSDYTVYKPNSVNLDIRKYFKCSCYYWEGVTSSFKLCNHMIAALDLIAKRMDCLNQTWNNERDNMVSTLLHLFIILNNLSIIDVIAFSLSDSEVEDFLLYLKNLPCIDCKFEDSFSSEMKADELKKKFLTKFQGDLQLEKEFSRIEGIVKYMKKNTINMIANNIQKEMDEQDWRVKFKDNEQ